MSSWRSIFLHLVRIYVPLHFSEIFRHKSHTNALVKSQVPRKTMMLATPGVPPSVLFYTLLLPQPAVELKNHCLSTHVVCSCNKEYAMFCHHFYYRCERGMPLLEWKIMFILWTEINSSVWEALEQDIYRHEVLFL